MSPSGINRLYNNTIHKPINIEIIVNVINTERVLKGVCGKDNIMLYLEMKTNSSDSKKLFPFSKK